MFPWSSGMNVARRLAWPIHRSFTWSIHVTHSRDSFTDPFTWSIHGSIHGSIRGNDAGPLQTSDWFGFLPGVFQVQYVALSDLDHVINDHLYVSKTDEFCTKNRGIVHLKPKNCVSKTRNCVLKMMNSAGHRRCGRFCARSAVISLVILYVVFIAVNDEFIVDASLFTLGIILWCRSDDILGRHTPLWWRLPLSLFSYVSLVWVVVLYHTLLTVSSTMRFKRCWSFHTVKHDIMMMESQQWNDGPLCWWFYCRRRFAVCAKAERFSALAVAGVLLTMAGN